MCTLFGIYFSPPVTHALGHHLRKCPETLFIGRPNYQGRSSLLTCGDIEQNPGPQHPEPVDSYPPGLNIPEAILGILADKPASQLPFSSMTTGRAPSGL